MYYTSRIPTLLVYKVMQDLHTSRPHGADTVEGAPLDWVWTLNLQVFPAYVGAITCFFLTHTNYQDRLTENCLSKQKPFPFLPKLL